MLFLIEFVKICVLIWVFTPFVAGQYPKKAKTMRYSKLQPFLVLFRRQTSTSKNFKKFFWLDFYYFIVLSNTGKKLYRRHTRINSGKTAKWLIGLLESIKIVVNRTQIRQFPTKLLVLFAQNIARSSEKYAFVNLRESFVLVGYLEKTLAKTLKLTIFG